MSNFASFHSIMSYGITFWENLTYFKMVLDTQKKIMVIAADTRKKIFKEIFVMGSRLKMGPAFGISFHVPVADYENIIVQNSRLD